jgi:hypothetical protein
MDLITGGAQKQSENKTAPPPGPESEFRAFQARSRGNG